MEVGGGVGVCQINDPLPESHGKLRECRNMPFAATIYGQWKPKFLLGKWNHREHLCKVS